MRIKFFVLGTLIYIKSFLNIKWKENKYTLSSKKLKESEIKSVQKNNLDINNDFGSYKIMLKTGRIELNNIHNHNDLNPKKKILSIKKALKNIICENPNKILNVGCGLGFETKALTEIYSCDITGVDVSEDGIEYAKNLIPVKNDLYSYDYE